MATKKATKKATTTKSNVKASNVKAIAVVNKQTAVSTEVLDLESDNGAGSNFGREDMSIPRINLLQSNSPQVKKGDPKFIKGAEAGDFLDSVTGEVFAKGDAGFFVVFVTYRRTDIEWIPRKKGGGFVADHGNSSNVLSLCTKDDETGAMLLKNGNEIVTTAEYLALVFKEEGELPQQVCISLAKTQLKRAKRINTMLSTLMVPRPSGNGKFNPAIFYSVFHVTSVVEQSKKTGESYLSWNFERQEKPLTEWENGTQFYLGARDFKASIEAGTVKVAQADDLGSDADVDDDSKL